MPKHQVTIAQGGASARLQLLLLQGYGFASRLYRQRGTMSVAWLLGDVFPECNSAILSEGDRRFKIYLNEAYYIRLLYHGFIYESEIETVLEKVISDKAAFIDCGANNGYWSVYAGLRSGHPERVVAIEATSEAFARLEENSSLNDHSFRTLKRAIYSNANTDLTFVVNPQRPTASTCMEPAIEPGDPSRRMEVVKSTTIDEVCDGVLRDQNGIDEIVVKIDVEGAEIEAFQGAQKTIARGSLLIYEDHGKDLSCRNTDFLLNQLQLAVYLLQSNSQPLKIDDIRQLRQLKKNPMTGYNLIVGKPGSPSLEKALRLGSSPASG